MPTLLEDLTSRDPHRIWASSCEVAKTRDPQVLAELAEHIPEIRRATSDVELGGALFSNRLHLDFALKKLEFVKRNSGCLCLLYPEHMWFDPNKEQAEGNVTVFSVPSGWGGFYLCECALCGNPFKVEEGEHHTMWWKWILAPRTKS